MAATDQLGRPLRDLRVSVTDRCNFRCTYCMPRDVWGPGHAFLPREELLTFEEITRVVRVFARLGVRKVRLTGGEPLLRRDVEELVAMIASVDGVEDLTMTTNGSLLADRARALRDAGLGRVTVSLDTLDEETFQSTSDVDVSLQRVLDGVDAAAEAGLTPVKLNAVVKRGETDAGIEDLAAFGRRHAHVPRFIEYMDVGTTNGWRLADVVPAREIVDRVDAAWPVEPVEPAYPGEVAERYRYRDGAGEVGVIASVTQPFCATCTRSRLSSKGELFTCLFAGRGHDLRGLLRGGASDAELEQAVSGVWAARTDRYSELRTAETNGPRPDRQKVEMSYLGG